jgi:hypothetical protein
MGWQDEWIERAEEIVRMEFDLSYRSFDTSWSTTQETQLHTKAKVRDSKFVNLYTISLFTVG